MFSLPSVEHEHQNTRKVPTVHVLQAVGSYQETKSRILIFHGMVYARFAAIIDDLFKQQIRKYNANSEI